MRQFGLLLRLPQLERTFKSMKQARRQRHLSEDISFSTLEGADASAATLDVDRNRCQRQNLRNTSTAPSQRQTEQPRPWRCTPRSFDEAVSLSGIEIFAITARSEEG
jgi:hypothetical protein